MDEIYDVVNKRGRKVGTATGKEVHKLGLLHKTVTIPIYKNKSRKEILVQQRSFAMHTHPGLFTMSAGGHIP